MEMTDRIKHINPKLIAAAAMGFALPKGVIEAHAALDRYNARAKSLEYSEEQAKAFLETEVNKAREAGAFALATAIESATRKLAEQAA